MFILYHLHLVCAVFAVLFDLTGSSVFIPFHFKTSMINYLVVAIDQIICGLLLLFLTMMFFCGASSAGSQAAARPGDLSVIGIAFDCRILYCPDRHLSAGNR